MVRDIEAYKAGIWDYSFINAALPNKIAVSDIDGVLERNGNFLFIEFKSAGSALPTGQYRMYEQLVYTGAASVLFVFGETNNPVYFQRLTLQMGGAKLSKQRGINAKGLANLIKSWYTWADKNPTIFYKKSKLFAKN